MTVKEEIRLLIESFPDDVASDALDSVRWLASESDTLTEEELAEVRLGEADVANGDTVSLAEPRQMLAR